MKTSLYSQAAAVDVAAVQAARRGSPAMRPREWEMLEPRLRAAFLTLTLLNNYRDRPGFAEFIADVEADGE